MAGRKLVEYVHVNGTVYGPDDDVPADVAEQITNPAAWGETAAADTADGPPPQSGSGSGKQAWVDYAASFDPAVEYDEAATRDDIIAAIAAAGHPVE